MTSRMVRDEAPLPLRRSGREFPYLGTDGRPATPATRARFFATAPMLRIVDTDEAGVRLEGGPFHAKQMGTLLTACGLNAQSWVKAWDVPFSATLTPVCLECAAIARYLARSHEEGSAPM
jgi:hypothetical protein